MKENLEKTLVSIYPQKGFYYLLDQKFLNKINQLIKINFGTRQFFLKMLNKRLKKPISYQCIMNSLNHKSYISYSVLKEIGVILSLKHIKFNIIAMKSSTSGSQIINPVHSIKSSPELANIIGHLLGDGGVSGNEPYYFNKNKELIKNFKKNCYKVFGKFKIDEYIDEGVICLRPPRIIGRLLNKMNNSYSGPNSDIPSFILNGEKRTKASFIRAIFDDESSVLNSLIVIEMTNKKVIHSLPLLLKSLDIESNNITTRKRGKNRRRTYTLRISGEQEFIKFYKFINFNHPKKRRLLFVKINSYKSHSRKKYKAKEEILSLLSEKSFKTSELSSKLKVKSSCLSHHLKKLKEEGLIETIPRKIERDLKGRFLNIHENQWSLNKNVKNNGHNRKTSTS